MLTAIAAVPTRETSRQVSTLKNIQIAQQMGIDTSDATWSGSTNPLDAKYAQLNTDLSLLSHADPMYARICAYIHVSHSPFL